ncbi:DUF2336 domain-containing protein [Aestuariivirga sp.]|uniref:DUF2336 domain-containing protein n=1 Tax=Aestuariivirga sp. TaxID=2650926 RepID=UPI00391CA03F
MKDSAPGLDTSVFLAVIAEGDAEQRCVLAGQLAAFLGRADTPPREKGQLWPIVLKLAVDEDAEVRRTLAAGLAGLPDTDPDVMFSIISDDDEIALPFLSLTPALSHWHMLAVMRVGDEARQAAVALRPDISPEAVAYCVEALPLSVNVLLFDNPAVQFGTEQYGRLYERFGHAPSMIECLLSRADLPLDIRLTQAKRAANRMHQLMAERGWLPANDASELIADAEDNAVLRILVDAGEDELAAVIPFLVEKAMLTPSIILRAACLGEMEVVAHALAHLAGTSLRRARALMSGRALGGFRSLHAKAGLPQSCFWVLQAACDVARDELEEPVPLTADEFGRRVIEALMTRYETMPERERPRHLDYVGRFAAEKARLIARRLKADLTRAA